MKISGKVKLFDAVWSADRNRPVIAERFYRTIFKPERTLMPPTRTDFQSIRRGKRFLLRISELGRSRVVGSKQKTAAATGPVTCRCFPFASPYKRITPRRGRLRLSRLVRELLSAAVVSGWRMNLKYCASNARRAASTVAPKPTIPCLTESPSSATQTPERIDNCGRRTALGLPG